MADQDLDALEKKILPAILSKLKATGKSVDDANLSLRKQVQLWHQAYNELAKLYDIANKRADAERKATDRSYSNEARLYDIAKRRSETDRRNFNQRMEQEARLFMVANKRAEAERKANPGLNLGGAFRQVGRYAIAGTAIYETIAATKSMVRTMIELEEVFARLQRIAGGDQGFFGQLKKASFDIAQKFGVSVKEVAQTMEAAGAQFKNPADVKAIVNAAAQLSTLSGKDLSSSVDELISTLEQFNMPASRAAYVADVFAKASANATVTVRELEEAASLAGSTMKNAGVSFEQFTAIVARTATASNLSGKEITQMLLRIPSRLGERGNQRILESNKINALQEIGNTGVGGTELLELPQILQQVANQWTKLNQTQRQNVAEALVGQRNIKGFIPLIEKWNETMQQANDLQNSNGEAQKQSQKILDTTAKSWQNFKTSVSELSLALGELGILQALRASISLLGMVAKGWADLFGIMKKVADLSAEFAMKPNNPQVANSALGLLPPVMPNSGVSTTSPGALTMSAQSINIALKKSGQVTGGGAAGLDVNSNKSTMAILKTLNNQINKELDRSEENVITLGVKFEAGLGPGTYNDYLAQVRVAQQVALEKANMIVASGSVGKAQGGVSADRAKLLSVFSIAAQAKGSPLGTLPSGFGTGATGDFIAQAQDILRDAPGAKDTQYENIFKQLQVAIDNTSRSYEHLEKTESDLERARKSLFETTKKLRDAERERFYLNDVQAGVSEGIKGIPGFLRSRREGLAGLQGKQGAIQDEISDAQRQLSNALSTNSGVETVDRLNDRLVDLNNQLKDVNKEIENINNAWQLLGDTVNKIGDKILDKFIDEQIGDLFRQINPKSGESRPYGPENARDFGQSVAHEFNNATANLGEYWGNSLGSALARTLADAGIGSAAAGFVGGGRTGGALGGVAGGLIGGAAFGAAAGPFGAILGGALGGLLFPEEQKAAMSRQTQALEDIRDNTNKIDRNTRPITDLMEELINAPARFAFPIPRGIRDNSLTQGAFSAPFGMPAFANGGRVGQTGPALVHANETVLPAGVSPVNMGGITLNISAGNGADANDIAETVIQKLESVYRADRLRVGNFVRRT